MVREPRGTFGRQVDKIYRQISMLESNMFNVKNDTEMECFPYQTLDDVISDNPNTKNFKNFLMKPVEDFENYTLSIVKPLKDTLHGFRTKLITDIDEEVFNGNLKNMKGWNEGYLQYIGMLFTLPRFICLLTLLFGCFMASIFQCSMQIICQSLQPRKIVDIYGKIALFSLVYVVGAQLSLFNILQSFGVPFYHIYVRFGAGFVYDVVADSILLATYIGMNNEFFFAIPKKRLQVTYTLPGVSDDPNMAPGTIL